MFGTNTKDSGQFSSLQKVGAITHAGLAFRDVTHRQTNRRMALVSHPAALELLTGVEAACLVGLRHPFIGSGFLETVYDLPFSVYRYRHSME